MLNHFVQKTNVLPLVSLLQTWFMNRFKFSKPRRFNYTISSKNLHSVLSKARWYSTTFSTAGYHRTIESLRIKLFHCSWIFLKTIHRFSAWNSWWKGFNNSNSHIYSEAGSKWALLPKQPRKGKRNLKIGSKDGLMSGGHINKPSYCILTCCFGWLSVDRRFILFFFVLILHQVSQTNPSNTAVPAHTIYFGDPAGWDFEKIKGGLVCVVLLVLWDRI